MPDRLHASSPALRVLLVFGTRPEAIKMAPLVHALREAGPDLECRVCVTGQHREMLDQVLSFFDLVPDVDLDLMKPGQDLSHLTARILQALQAAIDEDRPDWILVQGDTTTSMAAGLVAFYNQIKLGHVEAGLRTANKHSPFPEEINRRMTSVLADVHFAPTPANRDALLREGVPSGDIHVTGNTVIDALLSARDRVADTVPPPLRNTFDRIEDRDMVLVTGHRRESFGQGFEEICTALRELAIRYPALHFVYPVHLNPRVQEPVTRHLAGRENIHLLEPQAYPAFVYLMNRALLVLTDSGGVQEEAPSLGKPVLVMRETTERQEGIDAGSAQLVGTTCSGIVAAVSTLLDDPTAYAAMAEASNPYGDGQACERIVKALRAHS